MPDAHRAQTHIQVGETNPEQTHPRPEHMALIKTTDTAINSITGRRFGNFREAAIAENDASEPRTLLDADRCIRSKAIRRWR